MHLAIATKLRSSGLYLMSLPIPTEHMWESSHESIHIPHGILDATKHDVWKAVQHKPAIEHLTYHCQ